MIKINKYISYNEQIDLKPWLDKSFFKRNKYP